MSVSSITSPSHMYNLINPDSVAIIGASRNPESFSYPIVDIALRCGYTGKLFLINPKADSILGLKCYPSISDVPENVDVAMITLPKKIAYMAIDDCIKKGVKGIVIVTSGYGEQGDYESKKKLDEWVEKAVAKGIRIVGPNTLGYYSAAKSLDLLMTGFIRPGNTALITQSGNLTQSMTFPGSERGLGFSYIVDIGNQVDLQAADFINYSSSDPETSSIGVHIEGLRDGRRFMRQVSETVKKKPVLVFKSGRTESGSKMVASHTASIAGNDRIYSAAFRQCGAIQVDCFSEFVSALMAFNQKKSVTGNRMCIISEGGGDCVVATDACINNGLVVGTFSEQTKNKLRQLVPANGSIENPIDLAGWENVVESVEVVLEDDHIDGIIIVGGFGGYCHISPNDAEKEAVYVRRMINIIKKCKKPVLIYSLFAYRETKLIQMFRENGIPLFFDHHDVVKIMAMLVRYEKIRAKQHYNPNYHVKENNQTSCITADIMTANGMILEPVAKQILKKYHLPYPEEIIVHSIEESLAFCENVGYPVVMKIVSQDIQHKSDAGCVKLNISSPSEATNAYVEIIENANKFYDNPVINGVLISKMDNEEGIEIIIGGIRDATFGSVIMLGIGGIYVELLNDVTFRVCPLTHQDANDMIHELKSYPLLTGLRGKPSVDIDSIKSALDHVSKLMEENPEISELDLNPVKVHEKGLYVLDARIITK